MNHDKAPTTTGRYVDINLNEDDDFESNRLRPPPPPPPHEDDPTRHLLNEYKSCKKVIYDNIDFVHAHIKAKWMDSMLIGTEHNHRVLPDCSTPPVRELTRNAANLSDEEKTNIVINDPKFGMFSLFEYHLTRGYKNEVLKKKNAVYCAHIFSLLAGLPVLIFIAQWTMYMSLIYNQARTFDGDVCPNSAHIEHKLMMFAVSTIYFVRSFFLWDNLTQRTRLNKVLPVNDIWVILDTFQEFGFNLMVYGANLWLIFTEENLYDMVLNSVAMEFLMNLDNEFETMYFTYLPESAVDIYDNVFVTYEKNLQIFTETSEKSRWFRCIQIISFIPFKLLIFSLMTFPLFCFFMIFYGPLCK